MIRLFVYGSLLPGEPAHHLLVGSPCFGAARTIAKYALHDLGMYPAMVDGDRVVVGQLYEIDEGKLTALDEYEGHPDYYCRVTVALSDGSTAETYVLRGGSVEGHPLVPSGDWAARRR